MKIISAIELALFILIIFSCSNKKMDGNVKIEEVIENNYYEEFIQKDISKVKMVYPIEYYKNKIEEYQEDYYGFKDISMKITALMNISSIIEVDNVIPGLLTFLVCWINQKGNIYYLYTFNKNQHIADSYFCGQIGLLINQKQTLMKKLSGEIIDNEVISVGDFNNDGINEVALYTQYQNIGYVFCVYGFNAAENKIKELCLVPIFINFEDIFPSAEYIENGFRILEVVDDEFLELAWNTYIWNPDKMRYTKQ